MLLISTCLGVFCLLSLAAGISVPELGLEPNLINLASDSNMPKTKLLPGILKQANRTRYDQQGFSLDEIVENKFEPEEWHGTWVSDSDYVDNDLEGALAIFSAITGDTKVIVPADVTKELKVSEFWLSPDQRYVLLATRVQKLYRRSFTAIYIIYDIRSGEIIRLQPSPDILPNYGPAGLPTYLSSDYSSPAVRLHYAGWSPKGSSLVYVFNNNVYYRVSPKSDDVVLSTSGIPEVIFNGVCDWVYEEEVFTSSQAVWFSPDGKYIAWIEFNDTEVDIMPLEIYGKPGSLTFQYPALKQLRYPKPGRANPTVTVFVAKVGDPLGAPSTILLQPPTGFSDKEWIIYAVTWVTNTELSLTWETRDQKTAIVSICNIQSATCQESLAEMEPRGWLELSDPPIFSADGRQFVMRLSNEGYKHIILNNRDTNERVPLTSGTMVVTQIYHWDEVLHLIYFHATRVGSPGERHLYTVYDNMSGQPGLITCISCDVTNNHGGLCGFNDFNFSADKSFYIMSCKGPHVPEEYLYQTTPNKKIKTLVANDLLSAALAKKIRPNITNLDIKIAGGKYDAKVRLYLPPDFDEHKKYPLLVEVYAGPNYQQVNDMFRLDWESYLTTSESIIYALIDGRGSGFRGDDLLYEVYYNLGGPEVEDQLDVTRQLLERYSFLDASKVAIWGWSYGGYATLSALAADSPHASIFKCGIAVAPVTNWIYYDAIYTERYMGQPNTEDNLEGHQKSDVTSKAELFRGKRLLLVHGTADDNVHYQNSMLMTRALEEADVLFQQLSYPDENHNILSLRKHLYHSMTHFLLKDCFGREETQRK